MGPVLRNVPLQGAGATRDHSGSTAFRKFRRQLFHSSFHKILSPLTVPGVTRCADGHFRRVIYGLGPYGTDYPEQALLPSIVQNWRPRCLSPMNDLDRPSVNRSHEHTDALMESFTLKELWDDFGIVGDLIPCLQPFTTHFPRADIHELISMDLLHQVIKGTFKDHIVNWVEAYIRAHHEKAEAERILADIDHVYLPAIAGHVPADIVRTVADITELCHLVRRSVIDEDTLDAIDVTVANFHLHREVFRATVRPEGFSFPRQHSIVHYRRLIQMFGAPNGLCSSITESKHIKAVKRPYRRTNHNKPLSQILLVNQRLDRLAAARLDFTAHGMMEGSLFPLPPPPRSPFPPPDDPDDDRVDSGAIGPTCIGAVKLAKTHGVLLDVFLLFMLTGSPVRRVPRGVHELALHMDHPRLHELIRRLLYDQLNPNAPLLGASIQLDQCPDFSERVFLYNSARAVFYAPSDVCGIGGMHHERIRATKSWYRGPPCYDCVLLEHDKDLVGFRGLHAARVHMLFRFKYRGVDYPCALIHWFFARGDHPCPETGMRIVTPDTVGGGGPSLAVVHLDCLLRGAHLIGVAGRDSIPVHNFGFSDSLEAFKAFYVNKYADHHAHEIAF
ncbi:hypothetical protein DFH09DRAFT_1245834 [Mycena vulgaris]|nr:hypothetical protein DFH09DRAFT_1245834 [Mycena vulgaris]